MLALIYLLLIIAMGDRISRRFVTFQSIQHRLAVAILFGLLLGVWITYLPALLFSLTSYPLALANAFAFLAAGIVVFWPGKDDGTRQPGDGTFGLVIDSIKKRRLPSIDIDYLSSPSRPPGNFVTDLLLLIPVLFVVMFLMFATLGRKDEQIWLTSRHWSDFGPNYGLMQNFIFGANFPPENPHFSGELIRHHFLFWFESANLEYLGFHPASAVNLLSILTMFSTLVLLSVLGETLFRSRTAGRIGAALFFFSGSLAYIGYIRKQGGISELFSALSNQKLFISSGYPYPGEEWAIWTVDVFLQQRHFVSGIGILTIVLIIVIGAFVARRAALMAAKREEISDEAVLQEPPPVPEQPRLRAFVYCGIVLGLLPLWHNAVFVSAFIILAFLFALFPLRKQLIVTGVITAMIALPQLLFLRGGPPSPQGFPAWRLGYVVLDPSFYKVFEFIGFSIGFKWVLIFIAICFGTWLHNRILLSLAAVLVFTFLVQLSPELVANHKFINISMAFANLYAAYGLWRLWHLRILGQKVVSRILAVCLVILVITGGVFDIFPIMNEGRIEVKYKDDNLIDWVKSNTDPSAIFLTDKVVSHPILMAGRRLYYGHPLYAWSAGLDTAARDKIYDRLLSEKDVTVLTALLHQSGIDYVAYDDTLRRVVPRNNESVISAVFEKAFADTQGQYGNLNIYRVPPAANDGGPVLSTQELLAPTIFEGGVGNGPTQLLNPRGIATDLQGNIFIADTGNGRIQKFSASGRFLNTIGEKGPGSGQLLEPNGILVDATGNIFVTDASRHRLMKFGPDNTFLAEWTGPPDGFFGPRDIEFGPDGSVYVVDQGRSRIVRMNLGANAEIKSWGKMGPGEGEFIEPTGICIVEQRVYVTDAGNRRIQIFDLDGKFQSSWPMGEWTDYPWKFPDMLFDRETDSFYVTMPVTRSVFKLSKDGRTKSQLDLGSGLDNPSDLTFAREGGGQLLVLNSGSGKVSAIDLKKP